MCDLIGAGYLDVPLAMRASYKQLLNRAYMEGPLDGNHPFPNPEEKECERRNGVECPCVQYQAHDQPDRIWPANEGNCGLILAKTAHFVTKIHPTKPNQSSGDALQTKAKVKTTKSDK